VCSSRAPFFNGQAGARAVSLSPAPGEPCGR
jgi:hypothetical protein